MARRLNFTQRKRIKQSDVHIRTFGREPRRFGLTLQLESYELDPMAEVLVEAYHRSQRVRFPWGTVGDLHAPLDATLEIFEDPDVVKFRLKVVASGKRLLLATADQLKPREGDSGGSKSLLAVESTRGLGEIWRMDYTDGPLLQVSRESGPKEEVVQSPAFRALVLPHVLRDVLSRITQDTSRVLDDYEDGEWQYDWVLMGDSIVSRVGVVPSGYEGWVEDVVRGFVRRGRLLDQYLGLLK